MKYIDLHCDTLCALEHERNKNTGEKEHNDCIGKSNDRTDKSLYSSSLCVDLQKMCAGDALLQTFACFVDMEEQGGADGAWDYVMKLLDLYETETAGSTDNKKVSGASDALKMPEVTEAAKGADINLKLCLNDRDMARVLKSANNLNFDREMYALLTVEEGGVLNNEESRLERLYTRGIRLITLTWNYENCLGYPNSTNAQLMSKGLKTFGKNIVEKMNALKMLVDVSHLSDGGFYDVADIMKSAGRPFLASHSCARALCPHPRNLTDDMLKVIGNAGGIVGVNFYGAFLNRNGRSTLASIIEHLKYISNKAGIGAVALGSDFDGFSGGCEIENVSKMPVLFDAMAKAGFSLSEIEKIAWRNAAEFLKISI